jgi:hypothetical protein
MDDRLAGQRPRRDPCELRAATRDRDIAVVRDASDDRHRETPAHGDFANVIPAVGPDDRAHPLLRLRDHDLERRHARLAKRDRVEVDGDPGARAIRRLRGRAGDPAGAQVLEALDQPTLDELE